MNSLVELFENSAEFKRYKELQNYFSKHNSLNLKMKELKALQKKLVRAKVNNDLILVSSLQKQYNELKEEIIDLPFVDEYFELMENLASALKYVAEQIEISLNEDFQL